LQAPQKSRFQGAGVFAAETLYGQSELAIGYNPHDESQA
jgi:hypothetical protein